MTSSRSFTLTGLVRRTPFSELMLRMTSVEMAPVRMMVGTCRSTARRTAVATWSPSIRFGRSKSASRRSGRLVPRATMSSAAMPSAATVVR